MLDKLTIDDFSGRIGEPFAAAAEEGGALTLTLRSADALYTPPGDKARTPFSLVFTDDDAEGHVPQQTVDVEHAELGSFPLFVVPLGPSPEGMRYEAVFT